MSVARRVLADAERICAVAAPTFAEDTRAAYVLELLAAAGVPGVRDEVGNVLARIGGDGPAVVFAAHLDTVFGLEQRIDVFRDGDRVAAPGIGDNSLGVAALVELARVYADSPPSRPVLLAATVGEEGLGDLRGAKHLVATVDIACFVAIEGLLLDTITTAAIGSARYRVAYSGPGGHSWADRGAPSAIHGLLERAAAFVAAHDGLAVNVGTIAGGTSINTIAAAATLDLDLRAEDPGVLDAAAADAERHFGAAPTGLTADVQTLGRRPTGATAPEHPLVAAARRARETAGLPPAVEDATSTDANAAHGAGIPAITVGVTTGANMHRPDEYAEIAPIDGGMRALTALALELADR